MGKWYIDIGHNSKGDGGANGILSEDTVVKEIGLKVIDKLKALGHEVGSSYPVQSTNLSDSLRQRYNAANNGNYEFFVSIHANKTTGGYGSEVWIATDNTPARPIAQAVQNELVAYGFKNRGVKVDIRGLAVLQHTHMPAILIECFFVDSVSDCEKYNPDRISDAIVKGLVGRYAPQNTPKASKPAVKVGSTGVVVKQLQGRLTQIGFPCGALDGVFGAKTEAAVKAFQASRKLAVDGIVGSVTWNCLYN